jgi:archaellin
MKLRFHSESSNLIFLKHDQMNYGRTNGFVLEIDLVTFTVAPNIRSSAINVKRSVMYISLYKPQKTRTYNQTSN